MEDGRMRRYEMNEKMNGKVSIYRFFARISLAGQSNSHSLIGHRP
jgi:hypothetical protein